MLREESMAADGLTNQVIGGSSTDVYDHTKPTYQDEAENLNNSQIGFDQVEQNPYFTHDVNFNLLEDFSKKRPIVQLNPVGKETIVSCIPKSWAMCLQNVPIF